MPEIRSTPISPTDCEIRVWAIDPKTERDDLTTSLAECGTGLGQVLAMLYVAVTSEAGRTIIIDEPNSFLHPGAARKLVEILRQYPQQYIVSTHSSEIILASEPQTLNLVTWEGEESKVHSLNVAELSDVRRALVEIGARLSDVFGADAVLWVEGPTEEECFLKILRHTKSLPIGMAIVPVRNTGDLEAKRPSAKAVWEIYERLTTAKALVPRTAAFVLDRDGRNDEEIDELKKRSGGLVQFLPRRCYENYLLHSAAITAVLNEQESFKQAPIKIEVVEAWIKETAGNNKYMAPKNWTGDLSDQSWIKEVRAAKLLADLFIEVSNSQEEYRKTTHSLHLTDWLLENDPAFLQQLTDFLRNVTSSQ